MRSRRVGPPNFGGVDVTEPEFQNLEMRRSGNVLTCVLNRPQRRNAVDDVMHQELVEMFQLIARDDEVNAVVLTGAGKAFCVGGDLAHMDDQFEKHAEDHPGLFGDAADLFHAIMRVRQPIIAAVNGDALGVGASLAVLSDIVLMSADARIGDTHVRAGLVPGDGGLVVWPLLLSLNVAKELLFTGRLLSATEAQQLGLVNRVVDLADLLDEATKLAQDLASVPQPALRFTKRVLNKLLMERANYGLDLGLALEAVTLGTSEHKAAVSAFVARSQQREQNTTEAGEHPDV